MYICGDVCSSLYFMSMSLPCRSGITPDMAELMFLDRACKLDFYGVNLFPGKVRTVPVFVHRTLYRQLVIEVEGVGW